MRNSIFTSSKLETSISRLNVSRNRVLKIFTKLKAWSIVDFHNLYSSTVGQCLLLLLKLSKKCMIGLNCTCYVQAGKFLVGIFSKVCKPDFKLNDYWTSIPCDLNFKVEVPGWQWATRKFIYLEIGNRLSAKLG